MAHFMHVNNRALEVFSALDTQMAERLKWLEIETQAAKTLQKKFRGGRDYRTFGTNRMNAKKIQRFVRGHFARSRWTALVRRRARLQEKMVFDYYAEQVQKIFRGHYSRRYKHDFWARKMYIKTIIAEGDRLKQKLKKYAAEQQRANEEKAAIAYEKEFKKVTSGLHHLLSTKSSPGIYNNPYMPQNPKIKGVDVETHLRFAVKEYLETHKLTRKKYKPKRVRDRRSVRCSGRYGERRDKERMEMKFSKLKRLSNKPFVAGNPIKESERWKATPLNVGEPFIEQYQIQMTTKQLQEKNKEDRVSDKPFIFSVPQGKNFDDYDYAY